MVPMERETCVTGSQSSINQCHLAILIHIPNDALSVSMSADPLSVSNRRITMTVHLVLKQNIFFQKNILRYSSCFPKETPGKYSFSTSHHEVLGSY